MNTALKVSALLVAASLASPSLLADHDTYLEYEADFVTGLQKGYLDNPMYTDPDTGVMVIGWYYDTDYKSWKYGSLHRRIFTDGYYVDMKISGLGVCTPAERKETEHQQSPATTDCRDGAADSDTPDKEELLYLKMPDSLRFVSLLIATAGNQPEKLQGKLFCDSDTTPENGYGSDYISFPGPYFDDYSQLLSVPESFQHCPYLVLKPTVVEADYHGKAVEYAKFLLPKAVLMKKEEPDKPDGIHGCTPGYWKQRHHFDSWVTYSPYDTFYSAFRSDMFGMDKTLLEVLKTGGGKEYALGRHAVAALLNSYHDGVQYEYSSQEIVDMVYYADKSSYNDVKNKLEYQNEKGCPLN